MKLNDKQKTIINKINSVGKATKHVFKKFDNFVEALAVQSIELQKSKNKPTLSVKGQKVGTYICLIILTLIPLSCVATTPARKAEAEKERLEQIESDRQNAIATKAQNEAAAKETQRLKTTYGMTTDEFSEACETLITVNSGSNDFGFWDMTGIEEIAGSLFMQRSVYGKNAFGAKVEQRYKCWTEGNQRSVKIEQIRVEFH